jgi:D-aminopeptidase
MMGAAASKHRVRSVRSAHSSKCRISARDPSFGSSSYQATRESLVEDVNAAIRGLRKAGAGEIVVTASLPDR